MPAKYIPKIGDWFNAYQTSKSGEKHKHFLSPFQCNMVKYQIQEGRKYPAEVETEDFSFHRKIWKFEKAKKPELEKGIQNGISSNMSDM